MKHHKVHSHLPKLTKHQNLRQSVQSSIPSRQYFEKSMKLIQDSDCYRNDRLFIDGGFGDYRMSVFRVKDRKKRQRQPKTIITPQFISSCEESLTPEMSYQFHRIIKKPNQQYLNQQNPQKNNEANDEDRKLRLPRWVPSEQQHLSHRYVSDHQIQKWFSTFEISYKQKKQSQLSEKLSLNQSLNSQNKNQTSNPCKNRRYKGKSTQAVFMFRYMERKKAATDINKYENERIQKSLPIKFESKLKKQQSAH